MTTYSPEHVLVFGSEDEELTAALTTAGGFSGVSFLSEPAEALELIASSRPLLILVDARSPSPQKAEFLERLQGDALLSSIPVLYTDDIRDFLVKLSSRSGSPEQRLR